LTSYKRILQTEYLDTQSFLVYSKIFSLDAKKKRVGVPNLSRINHQWAKRCGRIFIDGLILPHVHRIHGILILGLAFVPVVGIASTAHAVSVLGRRTAAIGPLHGGVLRRVIFRVGSECGSGHGRGSQAGFKVVHHLGGTGGDLDRNEGLGYGLESRTR